jgi:GDPmannose 4,6-dehydratase
MNKAIITGITGQSGSHLADFLLSQNYQVVGITRRTSTDNTSRIAHLKNNPNLVIESGDITDYSSIVRILQKHSDATEFYNLAAQSHVGDSFKQPGLTWDITGKGCLNILQAIVDLSLQDKIRFYQASSSEMFGASYDESEGVSFDEPEKGIQSFKFQNENTKFLPQSPYAISKCAAHYAVRLYREAYGLHGSCGILFNHEGERRGENFVTRKITKWIGEFVKWSDSNIKSESGFYYDYDITKEMISVVRTNPNKEPYGHNDSWLFGPKFPKLRLGNLDAYRDWGYAGDYVTAMYLMLQQDKPDDYVVCTGETHTIREFLDEAFSFIGISDWSEYVVIDPQFYRPAEVDYLRGDSSKIRRLGWKPETSFKELVRMMVEHDIKNA